MPPIIGAAILRITLAPAPLPKGSGHKQAAAQLGRSERTIRQHAVEVYRKAGLQGRAELAALFLQDLMLPNGDSTPAATPAV